MAGAGETTSGKETDMLGKMQTCNNCKKRESSLMLTVHIQLLGKISGNFLNILIVPQLFLFGVSFPNQTEII